MFDSTELLQILMLSQQLPHVGLTRLKLSVKQEVPKLYVLRKVCLKSATATP